MARKVAALTRLRERGAIGTGIGRRAARQMLPGRPLRFRSARSRSAVNVLAAGELQEVRDFAGQPAICSVTDSIRLLGGFVNAGVLRR